MALIRLNARSYVLEVESSTPDTWLDVPNMRTFNINPDANAVTAEITDFDNAGYYDEEVMQRGAELQVESFDIVDDSTGAAAGAFERLLTLANATGPSSGGTIRFRNTYSDEWIVWDVTVRNTAQGGGTNDKSALNFTFTRKGAQTTEAVASS